MSFEVTNVRVTLLGATPFRGVWSDIQGVLAAYPDRLSEIILPSETDLDYDSRTPFSLSTVFWNSRIQ
jgi:hypothetical protein